MRALGRGLVALAFMSAAFITLAAGPASANPSQGGCTGRLNGTDVTKLTNDDPLSIEHNGQLLVQGDIPEKFKQAGTPPVSNTTIKMWIVDGVTGVTSSREPSTGDTYTANDVNLDDYRRFGLGLYRVDVENVGPPSIFGVAEWKCTFTAYIALDGDALSKPATLVAIAAVIVGAVGLLYAKGRKPRHPGWIDGALGTSAQIAREEAWSAAGERFPEALDYQERGEHALRPATPIGAYEHVIWSGKARIHGRWLAGFFWGLLLGLGIGVLGWQDNRWTVNIGSIVTLPLVLAVVSAVVAWIGWSYRIRDVAVLPKPSEADAAAAAAVESPESADEPGETAEPADAGATATPDSVHENFSSGEVLEQ
jgi:hypothetical protein